VISDRLKTVLLRELEIDDWDLKDETTAAEVPGWDSLSHARIIAAVEDAFSIRFHTRDLLRLTNIGQLQSLLDSRVPGSAG
jgi:acyl carrier protein